MYNNTLKDKDKKIKLYKTIAIIFGIVITVSAFYNLRTYLGYPSDYEMTNQMEEFDAELLEANLNK